MTDEPPVVDDAPIKVEEFPDPVEKAPPAPATPVNPPPVEGEVHAIALQRVVQKLGNGLDQVFQIEHPSAPYVTLQMFDTFSGNNIWGSYRLLPGIIELTFPNVMKGDQVTVVIIG